MPCDRCSITAEVGDERESLSFCGLRCDLGDSYHLSGDDCAALLAAEAGDERGWAKVRIKVVPQGLMSLLPLFPELKRWAMFDRRFGNRIIHAL